jgi:hypothetical protein
VEGQQVILVNEDRNPLGPALPGGMKRAGVLSVDVGHTALEPDMRHVDHITSVHLLANGLSVAMLLVRRPGLSTCEQVVAVYVEDAEPLTVGRRSGVRPDVPGDVAEPAVLVTGFHHPIEVTILRCEMCAREHGLHSVAA